MASTGKNWKPRPGNRVETMYPITLFGEATPDSIVVHGTIERVAIEKFCYVVALHEPVKLPGRPETSVVYRSAKELRRL